VEGCEHESITHLSNVVAETYWQRTTSGTYELATAGSAVALSRVLEEQTRVGRATSAAPQSRSAATDDSSLSRTGAPALGHSIVGGTMNEETTDSDSEHETASDASAAELSTCPISTEGRSRAA
jgi:hypothetical protein